MIGFLPRSFLLSRRLVSCLELGSQGYMKM
jgi:hypothetical protein